MEVEVIRPMLHGGKRLEPSSGVGSNPVIDLPVSEVVYLEGIGRVRRLPDAESAMESAVKTVGRSRGKA